MWTFTDTRDVSTGRFQADASIGTPYDLYFRQFASTEPDPVRRDVLVRNFLQANGIDPNSTVISQFLTSAPTLQRTQELSFALVGLRNTLTFRASQSKTRRLDTVSPVVDDLAVADHVRQRGLAVDLAHRLTSVAVLTLTGSYQKTTG